MAGCPGAGSRAGGLCTFYRNEFIAVGPLLKLSKKCGVCSFQTGSSIVGFIVCHSIFTLIQSVAFMIIPSAIMP